MPDTLDYREVPRVRNPSDDEVDRLVRSGQPFLIEEKDNEAFQRFAARADFARFRDEFGAREWTVQCCERGVFDPRQHFADTTARMPFSEMLDRVEEPHETLQHYVNVWPGAGVEFAQSLFDELRAVGRDLALIRYKNQELRVFWLGGAGTITPLHHDTYARSHGVVHGEKLFVLFPPDLRHFRLLDPYPLRSPVGWYSKIGAGPLDPERFPALKKTRPVRALCGPGDFLYLPPCWWHYVTIPSKPTISISATFYPFAAYFYWYHWRMRLTRWIASHERLLPKERRFVRA